MELSESFGDCHTSDICHWFAMTSFISRDGRVTALQVLGVSAPEKRAVYAANCGWYRGRKSFRPELWDGRIIFLYINLLGGTIMKQTLENIRLHALASLD